jgi:hypothetical protein
MMKHPTTGKNIWGKKELADIVKRRDRGETLKEIGKIYGVNGSSIGVQLRKIDIREERAALEERRRLKFREWGFEDPDSFINDEDQHKEEDYYT